jgi:Flp pilus assembly pilin Flp
MDETRYRLWKNEEGATAVEYAIVAALIAGVIGLTVSVLGGVVLNMFTVAAAMFP